MSCILAVSLSCTGEADGPYVILNGEKLTDADLKSDAPAQYDRIRNQYNAQVLSSLKDLARQKMIELAAEEKGLSTNDYIKTIVDTVAEPHMTEVVAKYNELRIGGQIREETLDQVRDKIVATLKREKQQVAVQTELSNLRKKYGFDMYRREVDIAAEPLRSNPEAQITVVEFSDFECPFCFRAHQTTAQVREIYGDKIKWVMKDFPLSFHRQAMNAHASANCVHRQNEGLYWKFFDSIFSPDRPEDILSSVGIDRLAASMGVDMEKLKACRAEPQVAQEISEDIAQGQALGVTGTPAFFINGRMISGAQPLNAFTDLIEEEL